jgi:hypothetical protein
MAKNCGPAGWTADEIITFLDFSHHGHISIFSVKGK